MNELLPNSYRSINTMDCQSDLGSRFESYLMLFLPRPRVTELPIE
ncbi:unnamed protein product, partial [Musa acuminata var. zebrina]